MPTTPGQDFKPTPPTKDYELVGQLGGMEMGRGDIRRAEVEGNRGVEMSQGNRRVEMWQEPVELPLQK